MDLPRILRVLCCLGVVLTLGACDEHGAAADHHDGAATHEEDAHADEVKLTPEAIRHYGIRVEPVSRHALVPTFTAPARVAFNAEAVAHVATPVKGRVVEIRVAVGDGAKAGETLLVVESPELGEAQGEYLQRRTALAVAESAVETSRRIYDRGKALHEQNQGISMADLQKREAEYRAAQGAARTAEAALLAIRNKLRLMGFDEAASGDELLNSGRIDARLAVTAPLSGQVIEREVTRGELVTPEKEALLVLANTDVLWVLADVPEARLAEVGIGSGARVRVAAVPQGAIEGKVSRVAPAINPATRTAQVRVEVQNRDGKLRPGMFAAVEFSAPGAGGETTLAVPEEAVQAVEGGPAVFVPVEGEENTFAPRAVTVGRAVGGMVPVLSGLKEGDGVVTGGTFLLKAELGKGEAGHDHDH